MIEGLSPFTRKLLALGLLLLAMLLGVNLLTGLIGTTGASVGALEDARFRLARLDALKAAPPPPKIEPLPRSSYFRAADAEAASELLVAAIQAASQSAQMPLEGATPLPADTGNGLLLRASISGAGPEAAVLGFVAALEREEPAVRLASWSVRQVDEQAGTVRIEAIAVAAWSGGA